MTKTQCRFAQYKSHVLHGEDGSDQVQGGDEDPELGYQGRQQQRPGRLAIGLAVAKHLVKEKMENVN